MSLITYRHISAGMAATLRSQDVEAMLRRHAGSIAAAARAAYASHPPHTGTVRVEIDSGRGRRANASVIAYHPAALPLEARHRILGAALDAARQGG